ncbi:hypothetical protein NDU88_001609 [Pleurodeles waltl]|uniref:Uncharacterized protein n=1 Tax=Pleurodeles waltl TaxID=8319 RepID=A0AAV7T110_PLEWA|nr:hypothetical protein NDU88_001609 [Pleurodeles waltl]
MLRLRVRPWTSVPGRRPSHWFPATTAGTEDSRKEASWFLRGERPDSEREFEGVDRRRGTGDYGGRCPGRRRNCSLEERTDVGIQNGGDPLQRRGPLAPGSTRVSRGQSRYGSVRRGGKEREAGGGRRRVKEDTGTAL